MSQRRAWPGVLLLSTLALLVAGLLVWGDHLLSPGPAGGIGRLLQVHSDPSGDEHASDARPLDLAAASAAGPVDTSSALPGSESGPPAEAPRDKRASALPAGFASPTLVPKRYALDLGTFAVDADAERAEAQLNQAGFSTVRFRQQEPARLFTVSTRRLDDMKRGPASVPSLGQGPVPPAVGSGDGDGESVRLAAGLPLRSAVALAERLRSAGHDVAVVAEAATAPQITLRHGNFSSRQEADAASRQIAALGVPNEVIQVR